MFTEQDSIAENNSSEDYKKSEIGLDNATAKKEDFFLMLNSVLTTVPIEHGYFCSKFAPEIYRIQLPLKKELKDYKGICKTRSNFTEDHFRPGMKSKLARFSFYDVLANKTPLKSNSNSPNLSQGTHSPFQIPKYRKTEFLDPVTKSKPDCFFGGDSNVNDTISRSLTFTEIDF
jgi:hypothetical protein